MGLSRTASKKGVHDREQKRSHGERENVRKKGGAKGYSPLLRSSAGTAEWEREMAELEGGGRNRRVDGSSAESAGKLPASDGGRRENKGESEREELAVVTPAGSDARKGRQCERGNSATLCWYGGGGYYILSLAKGEAR